jgi:hypothetical protein
MSVIKFVKQKALTEGDISLVIQMAWEDLTSFETIKERVGITEAEVIRLMRSEPSWSRTLGFKSSSPGCVVEVLGSKFGGQNLKN